MSLREFLERRTSPELTEIIIRDRLDPFDTAGRIEAMLARLIALVFNIKRDPNASEALSAADFIPVHGRQYREAAEAEAPPKIMTPAEMKAAMAAARKRAGRGKR